MILEQKEDNQIVFGGEIIETSIDLEDVEYIKTALSGRIYSRKFAFIPEILQNSVDISREVGTTKKVKVGFDIDHNGKFIYFQDFGSGINPNLMRNVVAKFGKSTKRQNNNSSGGFGIGLYALLNKNSNAYIITCVDCIKYTYRLSDNNGAQFILLNEESTGDENGTTVKVYVSTDYWEVKELKNELRKLAAYFEGVDCSEFNYPLIKNDHFYFTQDFDGDDNVHICYNGYYYEIPWKSLGMKPIPIKVAIPFSVGELKPSLNRETLQLEKHHLELIETKLLTLMSYLKSNVKTEFDNIHDYLAAKKGSKVEFVKGLWISYDDLGIENLVYTPLKDLALKDILPDLYWGTINKTKCELTRNSRGYCDKYSKHLLIKDKDLLNTKYFRSYVQGDNVIEIPRLNLHKWITFLQLKRFPKSEWRRLINLYMDWFEKEFKVITFTGLRDSQEFKDYVTEEKKSIVRQSSYKRDSITWIARWSTTNENFTVWDSNLRESNGDKIYVTNKTPKDKVEFLMSLISNTKIQMLKAKEENYEWVEEDNIVATVYYSLVVRKFLDTNEKWIKIAKQCLSPEVSKSLNKLDDFVYNNKVTISNKSYQFKESLQKLVELHSLTDPISKELEFIQEQIKEHEYFNWMKHEYYRSEETTKLFNYIQSLKNISK